MVPFRSFRHLPPKQDQRKCYLRHICKTYSSNEALTIDVVSTCWRRACLKNVPTLSTETGDRAAQPWTWTITWCMMSSWVSCNDNDKTFHCMSMRANSSKSTHANKQRWSNPKVAGSISTLVRVFLCPCVGPFPSVGLTLRWYMGWNISTLQHILSLYSFLI